MRLLAFIILMAAVPASQASARCVVLLHGLARTETSFVLMEEALTAEGWRVVRPGYPSRAAMIQPLADATIGPAIAECGTEKVDFVTHSMGGIMLRSWVKRKGADRIGRVVMLGPPNQGSEVVDELDSTYSFEWFNGPAGLQLGTDADGLPRRLPPVPFELGVIAGNQSLNPIFSTILPGPDDGKVAVSSTRVAGMKDHIVLPVTHTFMMNNPRVIVETVIFLQTGAFDHSMTWIDAVMERMGCPDLACIGMNE